MPPADLDDQGEDDDEGAVVGLTLRFALNARPSGSQGFAPGKANDQRKPENQKPKDKNRGQNQNTSTQRQSEKGDISNEVRKGTFLKSFDMI